MSSPAVEIRFRVQPCSPLAVVVDMCQEKQEILSQMKQIKRFSRNLSKTTKTGQIWFSFSNKQAVAGEKL